MEIQGTEKERSNDLLSIFTVIQLKKTIYLCLGKPGLFYPCPECPGMTDEEAAAALKLWCRQNNISYNDDMDNVEAAYRCYY